MAYTFICRASILDDSQDFSQFNSGFSGIQHIFDTVSARSVSEAIDTFITQIHQKAGFWITGEMIREGMADVFPYNEWKYAVGGLLGFKTDRNGFYITTMIDTEIISALLKRNDCIILQR